MAGCSESAELTTTAPPTVGAAERLRTDAGRIVARGDVAPDEFGPLELEGRYRASFTQQGGGVDFGAEVPFTARLEQLRPGGGAPRTLALFETAAAKGSATVTARGRWTLVVDFGDSPFEVILTRLR